MRSPKASAAGSGQESVWDFPRPPRVERSRRRVEVWLSGERIATSDDVWRVLETSHPPTYYVPMESVAPGAIEPCEGGSVCEWKGRAIYWTAKGGGQAIERAGWSYPDPLAGYEAIANHIAFYPGLVECYLDGQRVVPQEGGFYGGWITTDIVGPFKGGAGTRGW